MKLRWKVSIIAGAMLVLTILLSVIHHFQLRFAVERYISELKAKGEPMELAQVVPTPVPMERNSAALFWRANALFTTNDDVLVTNWLTPMHGIAPGKAIVSWTQPEIRYEDWSNSWDQLREAVRRNNEAFKILDQITNDAVFDFNLQYAQRFEMTITNLVFEKKAVQKLTAGAIYDLHNGDAVAAGEKLQACLTLVNGTADERTAISQLVRIAMAQIVVAATWELLQSTNLTDELLAGMQNRWSQPEFIHAWERALPVEREGDSTMVVTWQNSSLEFQRYFDMQKQARETLGNDVEGENSNWNKEKLKIKMFLWRYWWSYPDQLRYLKGHEALADAAKFAETNGAYGMALQDQKSELDRLGISDLPNSFDSIFSGRTDFHSMISESIVTLGNVTRKVMQVEAARRIVIMAIALKRYQIKHGNYPANSDSLVPEFVAAVPLDPVDGKPLRYRLNPDGTFLLYSIGGNGVDDGGNPAVEKGVNSSTFQWQNLHALDWVWPQPATAAEIEKYYQDQAGKR
jgi:hypothetical protein